MKSDVEKIRAFFAIEVPDGLRGWINGEVIVPLSKLPAKIKWVKPGNIHLTMRFLGEITFDQLGDVIQLTRKNISSISRISITMNKIGTFGGRTPRIIWIGVDGELKKLSTIHNQIENACRKAGLGPDDKEFSPHITIGRVKSPAHTARLLAKIKKIQMRSLEYIANELVLFKSTLTPDGPIYEVVERFGFD